MNSCIEIDNGEYLVELEYISKFSVLVRIKKMFGTHVLLKRSDVKGLSLIDNGGRYDVYLNGRKLATNLANVSGFKSFIKSCNNK